MKTCPTCKEPKPEFNGWRCKDCHNAANRELYQRRKNQGQSYEGQGDHLDSFNIGQYKCY